MPRMGESKMRTYATKLNQRLQPYTGIPSNLLSVLSDECYPDEYHSTIVE